MLNKVLLKELLSNHEEKSLEKHLFYQYLSDLNIDYHTSPILKEYFLDFIPNPQILFDASILEIKTIRDLENYMELIIPKVDRKLNGAFFTPDYIVDYIIQEVSPLLGDKNLDPSCGCGAFLIGLINYYKENFNKSIKSIVKENVFGADILDYNIRRSKIIITIYALTYGEILEENDFNLFVRDSLNSNWGLSFDTIVGNPPYVKFQDLSDSDRSSLQKNWKAIDGGAFNLYFAFFELGYNLLNKNGRLGYITPNNYFTSLAGLSLRRFFQNEKCIYNIIDFTHHKVFDAQTYTALTFINRKENDSILFDRIEGNDSPRNFLKSINGSPNKLKNLNLKKWRLLKTEEQENIKKIETIGTPIGKLLDISVGIATLKDEVFFVDTKGANEKYYKKTTKNGVFWIEKEITKPVYKISDFKTQSDVEHNTRRIICPYHISKDSATPILENKFKLLYPKCYEYLLSEKEILLSRDKGKVKFEPFYVWGRTQGLTKQGKKLLNPTFSQSPRFLLVEEEDAFFTNGYGTYFKEQKIENSLFENLTNPLSMIGNIDVIQKILNSYIMHYYIKKTSVSIQGGYPCYQKNFIEKFTIPNFTKQEINLLRTMDDKQEINDFLIEKYHLNLFVPNLSE